MTRSGLRIFFSTFCLLALASLSACAGRTPSGSAFCTVNGIMVQTDFESAAVHACRQGAQGPELIFAPEFAPINPSPWYAYRLLTESPIEATVTIRHHYLHGQHRYAPWTRVAGGQWQKLPEEEQQVSEDRKNFQYSLQIPRGGIQVAAQPVLSGSATLAWSDRLARKHELQSHTLLQTDSGFRLQLYDANPGSASRMILLLSRQHPPEVTGAMAYQDFVERLFESDVIAHSFRRHFRLVLVPLVNPDGVARGHWRMNTGGKDLNRDWGPFTQPETRAIAQWLATAHAETALSLMLDFHSTWDDVYYGQHPSDNPAPAGFNQAWYAAVRARLGDETPAWSGQHNPGLPTAKSWIRREFGVAAITYEVGDRTARDLIRHKARVSAEEMMRTLLSLDTTQKGYQK